MDTKATKTIAMAEVLTEVNSFSPVKTTRRDFEAGCLLYGDEIIPVARAHKLELGGFLKAADDAGGGLRIVPILKARAVPGGPVERDLFEHFQDTLLQGLRKVERLDGIYLAMHGSMGVEDLRDPEGSLLRAIRQTVGDDIPIGVTVDLHANITEEMARRATFIIGYKTNPHRDFFKVGYKAGDILIRTVRGQIRPVMAFNKLRLLKGGGIGVDLLAPMRPIFRRMRQWTKQPRVLDLSTFIVHIFIDDPEIGWSTIAVTDGDEGLARKLADDLADRCWAVRRVPHPKGSTPSEAIEIARRCRLRRKFGPIIFCDACDAVGAGAPGENTWILRALLEEAPDLTSYLNIRDEEAASDAFNHPEGASVTLTVGGKLEKQFNRPLEISGEILRKKEDTRGKIVLMRNRGIHLAITEFAEMAWKPEFWQELGLNVWKADIIVVKSIYPFRWYYLRYNRKTVFVLTPGTTDFDVFNLSFKNLPRPIFPFDDLDSWRLG
ncbi:MAG: M81 family metallopeptidase [Candidatus Abyssubacteria bacterium]